MDINIHNVVLIKQTRIRKGVVDKGTPEERVFFTNELYITEKDGSITKLNLYSNQEKNLEVD